VWHALVAPQMVRMILIIVVVVSLALIYCICPKELQRTFFVQKESWIL
jgi:hypothetical protein